MKIFALFFLLFLSISLQANEKSRILISGVDAVKTDQKIANALEELLVLEIGKRDGFTVLGSREVNQITSYIQEGKKINCTDSRECLVQLRNKLESEMMLSSSVATLADGSLVFSVNTINLETSAVGKRETVMGANLAELKSQIPELLGSILGKSGKEKKFSLEKGATLKLAVMPLEASGIDPSTGTALTQILNSQLNQIKGISVISQDDVQAMLQKTSLDTKLKCTDSFECLIEVGAAFGAGTLVTGTIGKVENTYILSLKLIDTRKAEVLSRVVESFCGKETELTQAVKLAAWQILGVDVSGSKGSVDFTINADEADLSLGEMAEKFKNGKFMKKEILPGRYTLKVFGDSDDYFPFQTDIYVVPDEKTIRVFSLLEKPTPWYKTWWFLTAAGTIITAAAVTTVYIIYDNPEQGSGTITGLK